MVSTSPKLPLARIKDSVEIDVSTRQKKLPLCRNYTNDFQKQQNSSDQKKILFP